MTAVMTAQGLGFDIQEAVNAAEMALRYNSSQVFEGILQSNDPDDLFATMFKDQLGEEEKALSDQRSSARASKSRSKGKEKAVDEKDYEDIEATGSFITENIDTQIADKVNFQDLMWRIAEEEPRGRSRTRELRSCSSQGNSPPRDQKASFEKFRRMMVDTRDTLYEGKARFRNGERNIETFLKAHGADWLNTFGYMAKAADFVSGGNLSKAGELMGQASQSANTSIRRGLRDLTGNATFAQETADYIMLAAEMVTPGTAAKAMKVGGASKVARWAGMVDSTAATSTFEALDLASISRKTAIHRNSLSYVGQTHVYVIRDASGKILKYGESAMGKNSLGQSIRAEAQAKKLKRQHPGQEYYTEIIKEFDTKMAARLSEANYIRIHRKVFGPDSLPLNKNNR
ncbi:hypothetical protein [Candidatus Odyssella thessalonicensis]|uniref:hypothetical protein n=1 Tax=Candidatus Odyssella thessalonicensis TaxID=84647 RepID=UPI000313F173|nr:hypothetical protein [Candidatus Odyssella thessalonicensis]